MAKIIQGRTHQRSKVRVSQDVTVVGNEEGISMCSQLTGANVKYVTFLKLYFCIKHGTKNYYKSNCSHHISGRQFHHFQQWDVCANYTQQDPMGQLHGWDGIGLAVANRLAHFNRLYIFYIKF